MTHLLHRSMVCLLTFRSNRSNAAVKGFHAASFHTIRGGRFQQCWSSILGLLWSCKATNLFQSLFGGVDPFEDFLDSASQGLEVFQCLIPTECSNYLVTRCYCSNLLNVFCTLPPVQEAEETLQCPRLI